MESQAFFVYGLHDEAEPDVIRYVGQTDCLERRLKIHKTEPIYGPSGFWKWSVRLFGRHIVMRTIEVVHGTRRDSLDCEQRHISLLGSSGRLVNGASYRKCNRAAGVPDVVADAFFGNLRIVKSLRKQVQAEARESEIGKCAYIAARIADELETKFKTLRMCGPYDSFRDALNGQRSPINKVDGSIRFAIEHFESST